ncbi:ABC transporter permease [Pseudonocardia kunmingensis]|uniref:Peptide/nickel transport system permease protein n=1 Tax=Pseudonocardia kunmingensis TaxID=630975 RepID=A0A543DPX1_9PSEU|nr:ABC transporter permease [Pseudonocardia kunmingensis]TQM11359.1 peptide/nickel transport system permease protein [Pseudonocardia kunmingensis]
MRTFRRFLVAVPLLFVVVSFGVFALVDLAPGDAAVALAGETATAEDVARVRTALGLDQPVLQRYGSWLGGVVTGDLGTSLTRRQDVGELVASRIPPTLSLALVALGLAVVISLTLGTLAAVRAGSVLDRAVAVFTAAGIALPQFWVGLLLVLAFSLYLGWLPATGYTPLTENAGGWLSHLLLPALALAWLPAAELTRHVRSATAEVLVRDHILTARAKGLLTGRIVTRHVLRNAGIPVITVLGTRIAQLLGGTVVIETVFGIQGLGSLTVDAVLSRDMPVILGVVALATGVVLVINYLVDLSYGVIDPRTARA